MGGRARPARGQVRCAGSPGPSTTPCSPPVGQPEQPRPTDQARPSAERQRLDDVGAPPNAAVEQHLDAGRRPPPRPPRARRACATVAVELTPPVVGDDDPVNARRRPRSSASSRGEHALDHQRAGPTLAHPVAGRPRWRPGLTSRLLINFACAIGPAVAEPRIRHRSCCGRSPRTVPEASQRGCRRMLSAVRGSIRGGILKPLCRSRTRLPTSGTSTVTTSAR